MKRTVQAEQPAVRRLSALAPLDQIALLALGKAIAGAKTVPARRELQIEGQPAGPTQIIVSGWAARVRLLQDGRRQFISFLLPGDLLAQCDYPEPLAMSTIIALTAVELCATPAAERMPVLAEAYAVSRALDEAYLLEQVVRLGRLSALERIVGMLLELHERLTLNGMAAANSFNVPLTQEILGDALGLTAVHINRTLQHLRRSGDLEWQDGRVILADPAALAGWVGRSPVRVRTV